MKKYLLLLCYIFNYIIGYSNSVIIISKNDLLSDSIPLNDKKIIDHMIRHGIKGQKVISNPLIEFSTSIKDSSTITSYKLNLNQHAITFDLVYFQKKINRKISINNNYLKNKTILSISDLVIDSMLLNIDYYNSEYYQIPDKPNFLLIVSKSTNWVGLMNQYSFFQLINVTDLIIYEFIVKD